MKTIKAWSGLSVIVIFMALCIVLVGCGGMKETLQSADETLQAAKETLQAACDAIEPYVSDTQEITETACSFNIIEEKKCHVVKEHYNRTADIVEKICHIVDVEVNLPQWDE